MDDASDCRFFFPFIRHGRYRSLSVAGAFQWCPRRAQFTAEIVKKMQRLAEKGRG